MVFNSILNLMQDDYEGVYKFLCRIFYENYDDLSLDECQQIFSAIENVRCLEDFGFYDFIRYFDCNGRLFKVLNELRPGGAYGIFTSEEEVNIQELDGILHVLTYDYFDIFNYGPELFCENQDKITGVAHSGAGRILQENVS